MNVTSTAEISFRSSVQRYRDGVYRDRILHDFILADAQRMDGKLTFLDIGCGKGFDTDVPLQESLVRSADRYIGIEPDTSVTPGPYIQDVRRCFLEDAKLPAGSINIAFAVMVLEHIPNPQPFWDKLHEVLAPGGVFWALTVDARHWFCAASKWSEWLGMKEIYLDTFMGERGVDRHENYPVHYRCNTPQSVKKYARDFASVHCLNLSRIGQCDPIFPGPLRSVSRLLESYDVAQGKPGTLLAIRAAK